MQEVVRAEVLKLFQADIIYPISDSPWVSPTQVVAKKSGITVVQNDKGEVVSTRLTLAYESIQACQMMEELLGQVMAKLLEAQIHEEPSFGAP
ncbi:hypothetical protein CK203_112440 [Vitis vinifera]|uniref:Uncharacterized protein n=1 Tax=Vitis vinifera TaxID=29760 RepID=A0A438FDX8_VITVI|nr:hypothetical protein CK203_112440 [Vitis vinifera]